MAPNRQWFEISCAMQEDHNKIPSHSICLVSCYITGFFTEVSNLQRRKLPSTDYDLKLLVQDYVLNKHQKFTLCNLVFEAL